MRWLLLFLLASCRLAAGQDAVEVGGVRFEQRVRIGEAEALLNGAGVRSLFGFKLYAIAVYLPQTQDKLADVMRVPGAKRIQVATMFELNADLFAYGLAKGLRKNLSESEFAELKERIDRLRAMVRAMDNAPAGSMIRIDWLPTGNGSAGATRLSINGVQRGEEIAGEDFFHAVLKVWLGEKVNDARLRDALLGRASG